MRLDLATLCRPAKKAGQDFAGVWQVGRVVVAAVADGAGGTSGGENAARALVDAVAAKTASAQDLMEPRLWSQTFAEVDRALSSSAGGGQTTAVVAASDGKRVVCVSAGDSIAWRFAQGALEELTHGQRRKPLLGAHAPPAYSASFAVQPGDSLLLATDGLWKYAPQGTVVAVLAMDASAVELAERLARLPQLPNGELQDDVGLALIRLVS